MSDGTTGQDRTLAAAASILGFALIVAYIDNYVRVIAEDGGLWQFHATRSAIGLVLLAVLARPLGLRLRPRNPGAVLLRGLVHAGAMLIYFGSLAFLPVATVAAGLFTAPIFVLLISRLVYAIRIGPLRILAVALGFLGVILVLGPATTTAISPAVLVPVAAGALYGLGNVATRQWCAGESAETLLAAFFAALGVFGLIGLGALALWQPAVPAGAAGFILRGAVWPTGRFLFWTFLQAAGSLIAVGLMIRAYQMAEASRVAIFEYVILPASAFWGYVLWSEVLGRRAAVGIVLIIAAGLVITLRARQP